MSTDVKTFEELAAADAAKDFIESTPTDGTDDIEDLKLSDMEPDPEPTPEPDVVPDVDTNVYPATDVVDLENEFNALKAKIADGTATDEDMARFSALIIQRQAAKTGKSMQTIPAGLHRLGVFQGTGASVKI